MARRRRRRRPIRHSIPIDDHSEIMVVVHRTRIDYFTSGDWTRATILQRHRATYELSMWVRIWPEHLYEQLFRVG